MPTATLTVAEYFAAPGSTFTQEDVRKIGPELLAIERETGGIIPEELLARAEAKRSPLHDYFTWDNGTAAALWRRREAQHMLANILVRTKGSDNENHEVRAFYSIKVEVRNDGAHMQRRYFAIERVQKEPNLSSAVLEEARRQLLNWADRVETYTKVFPEASRYFAPVLKAVEKVREKNVPVKK